VTEKEQLLADMFPLVSVATQLTFVTPLLKVDPEDTVPVVAPDAVQANVTPGQLSAAVTVNGTAAVQTPGSVDLVMGDDGQAVNVGFSVSFTVTVKLQAVRLVFPLASVAVQVTAVVPLGNVPLKLHVWLFPDVEQVGVRVTPTAVQAMLTPGQLSEAVALNVVTAEH
jgi:hypothetical protein